ncbi:MAG: NADH-quinone oxidoreductase subunit NuoK [Candidatus Neomarinimicrobiota bacterium]|nr:MAG: NADH-quinone oxidoreductase subunit NuoK [Candidatus Neomarinimicrobiota bacterium]
MTHSLSIYLLVAAILFGLGVYAIMTRRNAIAILMGVELVLNAANLNFVAFARFGGMNSSGHVFALFVIVLAAAEAAVALAIIINLYHNLHTINVEEASTLKQ